MSLSHPGHSFETSLSDGRKVSVDFSFFREVMQQNAGLSFEERLENFHRWTDIRVEDLNEVADQILEKNLPDHLSDVLDESHIFLSGHSLGGAAALWVGRMRPELFRGVIALEAPFFGEITGATKNGFTFIDEPYPLAVLHFYSDALWEKLPELQGSEYDTNARLLEEQSDRFRNVHLEGTGHLGLTDMRSLSPVLTRLFDGGLDTADYSEVVNQMYQETLDFLKQFR